MKHFSEQGFVVWSGVLAVDEIDAFRAECSALYADHKARGLDLLESGCVMDLYRDTQIKDQSRSRTDAKRYMELREDTVEGIFKATSVPSDTPRVDCRKVVLDKLAHLAGRTWTPGSGGKDLRAFLFNEHYILKPRQSEYEFRWHQDAAEQLAMCFDQSYESIPYVSAWVPLCDMSSKNGTLVVLPRPYTSVFEAAQTQAARDAIVEKHAVALNVKIGDVVFFRSDLWHSSGSNRSHDDRMAYYAQFSPQPITGMAPGHDSIHSLLPQACGGPNENSSSISNKSSAPTVVGAPPPLLFAVPCGRDGQPRTTAVDDDIQSTKSGNRTLNVDLQDIPSPRTDSSKTDAAVDCGGATTESNRAKAPSPRKRKVEETSPEGLLSEATVAKCRVLAKASSDSS